MDMQAKIKYNKGSAQKHGWDPRWFGSDDFNVGLVERIAEFQEEHDLEADGLCGPMTYARALTEREARAAADHRTRYACVYCNV